MTELYNWFMANPLWVKVISFVVVFGLGYILPPPIKVQEIFFNVSQFIRKVFGRKAEETVEKYVDAIHKGLHSDNIKE